MKYIVFLFLFMHINIFAHTLIDLNQEEIEWLQKNKKIVLGIDKNFAPFEFVDKKGVLQGMSIDYLKEIEKILSIKFNIIKTKEWNEIIAMTKKGRIDVLSCIPKTEKREEYLNFTTPYISIPMVIVTNKTTGFIYGLKELEGRTVAVIDDYTPDQLLQKYYPNIHLVRTKNLEEALRLVASGKTFAHVGNLSRITNLMQGNLFENLAISGITEYKYEFSIGIRKDDSILQSIMQKALEAIPYQVKKEIYSRWFPIQYKEQHNYTFLFIFGATGSVLLLFLIFWILRLTRDIKRKSLIEKQLIQNVKWLSDSLCKANVGAWHWDLRTNIITGNSVYSSIMGISNKEVKISAKEFQKEIINQDDFPYVLKELESYFNKEIENCSAEFRINAKDGKIKKIYSSGKIFEYDAFNNPAVMSGFIKEIKE